MKIRRKKLEDDVEIEWECKGPEVSDKAIQCDLSDDSDHEDYLSNLKCGGNLVKVNSQSSINPFPPKPTSSKPSFEDAGRKWVKQNDIMHNSINSEKEETTSKAIPCQKDLSFNSNFDSEIDNEIILLDDDDDEPFDNKRDSNKKTRKGKKRNAFILSQAEDVDESMSGEEEAEKDSSMNSMASFIVDDDVEEDVIPIDPDEEDADLQPIPARKSNDLQGYLKSLSSMVGRPEQYKYKLKYDYDTSVNVYSQAVVHDENDEYQNDSFCTEDIIIDSDDSVVEIATPSLQLRSKRTLPRKTSTPKRPPAKKRKRVILLDDDEDDQD